MTMPRIRPIPVFAFFGVAIVLVIVSRIGVSQIVSTSTVQFSLFSSSTTLPTVTFPTSTKSIATRHVSVKKAPFKPDNRYKNICFLNVKDANECKLICHLDIMCYYSFYYPTPFKGFNCFTQLFYNDTQADCLAPNTTDSVLQLKDIGDTESYNDSVLLDSPTCLRPNYHPFDSSLTFVANRHSITEAYKCNTRVDRRFKVDDHSIVLTKDLASDESCQFRYIFRTGEYAETDEAVSYSMWYLLTKEPADLNDEFVEIECKKSNRRTYIDYLSYVPDKLAQKRSKEASERPKLETKSRRFEDKMSVVMFGVDSTSFAQGYRHLPRTLGYLRQNMDSIVFKGHNRVQDNTFMNLYPMLTGKPIEEGVGISMNRFFDDDPLIFKWFNNDSFVTGYYEDYKMGALFNWLKKGFHYSPADHYSKPFAVHVEKTVARNWFKDFCYLDKGMHVWEGDWTRSFIKQYYKVKYPYFLWSWTTMISHESPNTLGMGDAYYYNLFKDLDESNALNNTILVFYSDHGFRYGGLRATKVGQHEENSPMMNWIIPKWFQKKYYKEVKALRYNAGHSLTSPYDVHRTLLDFADGALESATAAGMKKFGKSFFERIDNRRTCADAGIPDHFCGCRRTSEFSLDDPLTKKAAQAIVDRVNVITSTELKKCLRYTLRNIKAAYISKRYDLDMKGLTEIIVTAGMKPSDAVFSATVHVFAGDKPPEVKGISRVSLYGNSANCVSDFEMRLYCSCKGLTSLN